MGAGRASEDRGNANAPRPRDRMREHRVEQAETAPGPIDHGDTALRGLAGLLQEQRVMTDESLLGVRDRTQHPSLRDRGFDPARGVEVAMAVLEGVAAVEQLGDRVGVGDRPVANAHILQGTRPIAALVIRRSVDDGHDGRRVRGLDVE